MQMMNFKTPLLSRGFTLLEILISVLVLSIGLLGLAGLQTLSLRSNHSAYLRSQATLLAYDIIDKMRANPQVAQAGAYLTNFGDAPNSGTNCETATCAPANLAVFDLSQWKCMLGYWNTNTTCSSLSMSGSLPRGDGQITQNNNIITVAVRYEERDGNTVTLQISSRI